MTASFDPQFDSDSSLDSTPPEQPLGPQQPLGMQFLQSSFLTPLGASPLGILDTSTFTGAGQTTAASPQAIQRSPISPSIPPAPDLTSSTETHASAAQAAKESSATEPTVAQMLMQGSLPQLPTTAPLTPRFQSGSFHLLPPFTGFHEDRPAENLDSHGKAEIPIVQPKLESPAGAIGQSAIAAFPAASGLQAWETASTSDSTPDSWASIEELLSHSSPGGGNEQSPGHTESLQRNLENFSPIAPVQPTVVQPSFNSRAISDTSDQVVVRASPVAPVQFNIDYSTADNPTDADLTGHRPFSGDMPIVARGVPVPEALQGVPGGTEYSNTRLTSTVERAIGDILPKEQSQGTVNLEPLAREIYGLIRQRLEIERERRNVLPYSGRLSW